MNVEKLLGMDGNFSKILSDPLGPYKEHRGDPMDLEKIFHHPISYKFSRKIREIFKILCWMWNFCGRNGNFLLREPGHKGDPKNMGNFPTHPIPNKFSTFIREIFKILAWG